MSAQILITRLTGVRNTGPDRWVAKCPAHEDRSPSLSLPDREGRVLLHCFGGCGRGAVLGAVGLRFSDIMPERIGEARPQAIPALQVLEAVAYEIMVAALLATELGYSGVQSAAH